MGVEAALRRVLVVVLRERCGDRVVVVVFAQVHVCSRGLEQPFDRQLLYDLVFRALCRVRQVGFWVIISVVSCFE